MNSLLIGKNVKLSQNALSVFEPLHF